MWVRVCVCEAILGSSGTMGQIRVCLGFEMAVVQEQSKRTRAEIFWVSKAVQDGLCCASDSVVVVGGISGIVNLLIFCIIPDSDNTDKCCNYTRNQNLCLPRSGYRHIIVSQLLSRGVWACMRVCVLVMCIYVYVSVFVCPLSSRIGWVYLCQVNKGTRMLLVPETGCVRTLQSKSAMTRILGVSKALQDGLRMNLVTEVLSKNGVFFCVSDFGFLKNGSNELLNF